MRSRVLIMAPPVDQSANSRAGMKKAKAEAEGKGPKKATANSLETGALQAKMGASKPRVDPETRAGLLEKRCNVQQQYIDLRLIIFETRISVVSSSPIRTMDGVLKSHGPCASFELSIVLVRRRLNHSQHST